MDTPLAYVHAGIAAAQAADDIHLECRLQAHHVHVLANLGQNETALQGGYKALRRALDIRTIRRGSNSATAAPMLGG